MTKKTDGKELQKQLAWEFPNIGKEAPEQREKAEKYCRDYKGRGGGVLGLPEGAHEGDGAWAHKEGRAFHTPLADPLPPH